MKKIIKLLLYSAITIIALIAIAIGAIIFFVNPNQFKPQITELVQRNTGIVLTIDGDIEWTFFPWIGIKVQNITASSANTPTVPLATIQMAEASVLLKSLMNRELNVNDVMVEGLTISLLKDANGHTNWQFSKNHQAPRTTQEEQNITNNSGEQPIGINDFYVRSITIKDANLIYKDAQTNQALALKNLTVQTGEIQANAPISISFKTQYALFNPKIEGDIELTSTLNLNKVQQIQISTIKLKSNISIDQNIKLLATLSTALDMDLTAQSLQLSDLTIALSGNVNKLTLPNLNIVALVKADLNKEIINAEQLKIVTADAQLSGNIAANNFMGDQLTFTSSLTSNSFNLKELLHQFQIQLPKFSSNTALQKASLQMTAQGNLKNIHINPLKIVVDQSTITGSTALALGDTPTIAIALKGDKLLLQHYFPQDAKPDQTTQQTESRPMAPTPQNPEIIPLLPKTVDIVADIHWNQLQLDQLQLNNNRLKGSLKNGSITIEQLSTNIYDGTITLNGSLKDAPQPTITLNGTIKDLKLSKIIPQVSLAQYIKNTMILSRLQQNNKSINVQGSANAQFKLHTTGRTQHQLVTNLNGDANFDLLQGKIINFNYEKLMCQGIALLNRQQLTSPFDRNDTDFQKLSGKISIHNGIITNNPLQVLIPGLVVNGNGQINLNRMTISYKAQALLTGDRSISADPACQINDNFKNIAFPILCEGSLEKPDSLCRLDTAQLGNIAGKLFEKKAIEKVNKEIDKQKDQLKNQLNDKIDKEIKKNPAIKGLLKNFL